MPPSARRSTLEDIGFVQQAELFDRVAERTGAAPPVIDAEAVRADPGRRAAAGCARRSGCPGIRRCWPGRRARGRATGSGRAHWYGAVEASTGFAPPDPAPPPLSGALAALADAARPAYERLRPYAL